MWLLLALQAFSQPDAERHPQLYRWNDTCNVYVLRDGEHALLIDLGDGSVLDRLRDLGVSKIDAVLFTQHHRENTRGASKLRDVLIGAPEAERELFENPTKFRRMNVRLSDPFTIHGTSYVRPPIQPVKIGRGFKRMDVFAWRGREIWCVDTRGDSPGAMSYLLKDNGRWLAFSGDVMLEGGKMRAWYDVEWDYGFGAGLHALTNSAGQLAGYDPEWLLPSQGAPVRGPDLLGYVEKLRTLEKLLIRGYDVHTVSGSWQDKVSRPSEVPHLWRVSKNLYKLRGPNYYPNFYLILSESGRGLVFDCGVDEKTLGETLTLMKERLGLKAIDAAVISHMHGDHFVSAPWLRETWGAKLWAIDRMGPVCEFPERFDYCAPIQAYGHKGITSVKFDRLFRDGETFEWEGYKFQIDWMPGQTEFALAMWGEIDGRRVVFTGDNIFGDPDDPSHTGHEAMVAHNSAILEEGYIYGAEYLSRLKPDLIAGGHSYVMDKPAAFIERYRRWAYAMRDAFKDVLNDYPYDFDPFWVRAEPYRVKVKRGETVEVDVHIRNHRDRVQKHRIEVHAPPGLVAETPVLEGERPASSRGASTLRLRADASAEPGVKIVAFDITLDGRRYGELFDLIVEVLAN
jgi:glyoxylase-like metal-dependent hydrolase (beta-lactamase superfamily II)